ncbi:MAG: DinB family protein [Firmicutes bacterium]|nr:DinB family protein [Bacillota bacterium]
MQKKIITDYLDLLDSQREAIFGEIKGVETSILWQRPAEKEWSIGENLDHGRVLLRSFRRLLKIFWSIFVPYARLKRCRHYEVYIDDVYERSGFPLNVGWIWPPKYNAENPVSLDSLNELYINEHLVIRKFYKNKQEELLGNLNIYDPAIGWINLIQALRVGIYHDEHHFRQVRKLYTELKVD